MPIDHVLKLYSESIRSPYLHYGFWDNPDLVNTDELTLNEMVAAQERYIEHLVSFIPEEVKNHIGCRSWYRWKLKLSPFKRVLG